jgi:hypothetical protein
LGAVLLVFCVFGLKYLGGNYIKNQDQQWKESMQFRLPENNPLQFTQPQFAPPQFNFPQFNAPAEPAGPAEDNLPIEPPADAGPQADVEPRADAEPQADAAPRADPGPRADARTEAHEIAGVRVRVKRVWVSLGYDDGSRRLHPSGLLLKVQLAYECLDKKRVVQFRNGVPTAQASAVYDEKARKYEGVSGGLAKTIYLRATTPNTDIIHFQAPKPGVAYLDLDYVPEFVPAGEMFRFRIPAAMIEWPKK